MRLYLAGVATKQHRDLVYQYQAPYLLASYMYVRDWHVEYMNEPFCKGFMLDSGGFTYLNAEQKRKGSAKIVDWNDYVDQYGDYVRDNDIKLFFEMDVDVFVGHKAVLKLTDRLENRAQRPCIPIWHYNRGKAEYERLCRDYSYIAFGGLVTGEVKKSAHMYFNSLVDIAHRQDCEIHGLGITSDLYRYRFDSVDSRTWQNGIRYGLRMVHHGNRLEHIKPKNTMSKLNNAERAEEGFRAWVEYSRYLDQQRF